MQDNIMGTSHRKEKESHRLPNLPLPELKKMRLDVMERIARAYELPRFKDQEKVARRLFEEKRQIDLMINCHE